MDDLIIKNARIVDGSGAAAFEGDVAVKDGKITEVGSIDRDATRVIDAEGKLLTPGFVDIHTHFDGQVCWDKQVTPSCWHGVTTVVMGNCGVGFAPVKPGKENELIELMESVEDIPGTALHDGIPWGWESFAGYLDAIDTPYTMDIGTQVPHVALRHYVMGDRSYDDDATADDMAEMAKLTREGLEAGALGFSTSRFYGHRDKDGNLVPGTNAGADEMLSIAEALAEAGHGTMEIISDHLDKEDELRWIEEVARRSGRPLTLLITGAEQGIWDLANRVQPEGVEIRPQVGARPASILMTLEGTVNPMRQFPSYKEIKDLPFDEQRKMLKDPDFRAKVLADKAKVSRFADTNKMISRWHAMYVLPTDLSYEPGYEQSIAGIAEAQGIHVREALMDAMADKRPLLVLLGVYKGDLEVQRQMIENDQSVFGLSDGGAHCGVLCDASMPTYMLAYMTRDRAKGPKIGLEYAVHKMTKDTAELYGLDDRGVIAPGYRADINIIDYDALSLVDPEMVYDLPAGGKRLIQKAEGYTATICAGEVTYENGEHTGAMPGRLVRGGQ